ncbi:DUF3526 domain-containing protein [Aquimarina muelleri]|uniref:ABC-2 type transport system permease protein n=1 Tax=Aquimarina muelleri TaxID=279356 RepID=A0A918N2F4_9FLAO|nr:DUF3526 domain-containing protein [Aquimarina muelleri]MCX2762258.1 DUF3526 domain-containing protein [Aquimarina muelleri]GGX18010.1 hypothetical protein GCM10007384_19350 [Aquimarina muelleri]
MKTIFLFEWKKLARTPLSISILVFFIGLGAYSIYYGYSITKKQIQVIHDLENLHKEQVKTTIGYFNADTTTHKGKALYNKATQPGWIEHLIKPFATFYPNSFSSMAIGHRDVYPFYKEISTKDNSLHVFDADISNPEILIAGNFDLSFVIIYLIPLLMIVLCHNIISEEKELGTFILLKSQSNHFRKIIFYKLFFRTLIVLTLTYILNIVAAYISPTNTPISILNLLYWLLIVTCYLFFWFAICYLLISFQKNSIVTSLYMIGSWLLLSIILPSLFNFYIDISYPKRIKADMASEKRKIEESVWDLEPKVLLQKFYNHHPEYNTQNSNDTIKYSSKHFVAYYDALEKQLAPIAKVHKDRENERKKLMSKFSEFIPTLKMQKTLNQIGNTDFNSYIYFEESTLSFQKKWKKFIYDFIFKDENLQVSDYLTMPEYPENRSQIQYKGIVINAVEFILLALLIILLQTYVTYNSNKYLTIKQ